MSRVHCVARCAAGEDTGEGISSSIEKNLLLRVKSVIVILAGFYGKQMAQSAVAGSITAGQLDLSCPSLCPSYHLLAFLRIRGVFGIA